MPPLRFSLVWLDDRRERRGVSGLLPIHLFRVGAYSAGALVQLCFSASMNGFFFILSLWLQAGEGTSPFISGRAAVAFSVATMALAGVSVPLAIRFGRRILVAGRLLLGFGIVGLMWLVTRWHGRLTSGASCPASPSVGAGLALLVGHAAISW